MCQWLREYVRDPSSTWYGSNMRVFGNWIGTVCDVTMWWQWSAREVQIKMSSMLHNHLSQVAYRGGIETRWPFWRGVFVIPIRIIGSDAHLMSVFLCKDIKLIYHLFEQWLYLVFSFSFVSRPLQSPWATCFHHGVSYTASFSWILIWSELLITRKKLCGGGIWSTNHLTLMPSHPRV